MANYNPYAAYDLDGPIGRQNPTPGFRAPPLPPMPSMAPPRQQQGGMPGMGLPPGLGSFIPGMGGGAGSGAGGDAAYAASPMRSGAYIGGSDGAAGGVSVGSADAGAGAGGAGSMAALAPFGYAAAIGVGANTEANHANTPVGDGLLAGLGPSAAQMWKDPVGMGLPTLLGFPFLTPFTASSDAKATKPEFSSIFGLGF